MTDDIYNKNDQTNNYPNNVQNAQYFAYAQSVPQRQKREFSASERAAAFVSFIAAFLFFRFCVCETTGFVTTAVFILINTAAIVYMKKKGCKFSASSGAAAALIYIFSTVYFITDNGFIKFLNTVFLILMGVFMVYTLGSSAENQKFPRFFPLVMLQAALSYPLEHFGRQPEAVVRSVKKGRLGGNIGFVIIGIVIAVPLTLVVGSLLMSADSGVEDMLAGIADFIASEEMFALIWQLIISVPIACYIFGMIYANTHRDREKDVTEDGCERALSRSRLIQNITVYTAVTPICLLYILYMISQAQYLMSAFSGTLPDGYSYAEYARRGFFELLAIVVINLVVVILINLLAKNGGENKPAALKLYSAAICFFTLVIIASALSKMAMYISVYGLTELRVFTGWFMALCAFIFLFIIIKQFGKRLPLAKCVTITFIAMFALLAFGRPDYVIGVYNIEMSRAGKLEEYDSAYLLSLSDDAVQAYLEYGCDDGTVTEWYMEKLQNEYQKDAFKLTNISSIIVNNKIANKY